MSYIDPSTVIDARTGEKLRKESADKDPHAVHSHSYIYETNFLHGLEGLPQGARLTIYSHACLKPLRLDRTDDEDHEQIFSFEEIKAALSHPEVSKEETAKNTEPPERGQVLAVYNAVTRWIADIENEWHDLAAGEAMSAPAAQTLDPVLLELHETTYVKLTGQMKAWVKGEAQAVPASVALSTKRTLEAALAAWAHAIERTLYDQLEAIAQREGVKHVWPFVPITHAPNAIQCAETITRAWWPIGGGRVLWRPSVSPESTAEFVAITLKRDEVGIGAVTITVDRQNVSLEGAGEGARFEHQGRLEEATNASEQIALRLEDHIANARREQAARKRAEPFANRYGPTGKEHEAGEQR